MSGVIKLCYIDSTIALVMMEERESKNTFSHAFIEGLGEVFNTIANNPELKVVIIHGFDNYFCCGGTQDELLKLAQGTATFADIPFYRLLLDCKLPVIAAMQGHALGGGLAFGCFADLLVLGEEPFYATNFMKYGITPGFGSTYMIPKKFNKTLADNMLLDANNHQGSELKSRGVNAHFVKRADVINTAINLAKKINQRPREFLLNLKQTLRAKDYELLPIYIEQELAMHAISFKLPEVVERIKKLFGK